MVNAIFNRNDPAMIGSSRMFKSGSRRWYAFILPGIMLLTVFFIYSGGWRGIMPGALAARTKIPATTGSANNTASSCSSSRPDFGGTVVVDTNEIVCDSLMAFGSKVAINGEVRGDVDAFGSTIVVAGKVDGNIVLYNGTLTLQNGSSVDGTIELYGSRWEPGAGSFYHEKPIIHPSTLAWLFGEMSQFSFPFWSILIWAALGLMLTWLLPEHVTLVRATAIQNTKRSFIVGLLSILLAPVVLVVLTALILPIPLAVIIALGLVAAWAFGTVALGWLVGEHIVHAIDPRHHTRTVQVVVGLAALALLGSLPYVGWLINLLVGLIGLGTVFLSRFGTRLYGQPRRPLDL